jgi:hypothetical protein
VLVSGAVAMAGCALAADPAEAVFDVVAGATWFGVVAGATWFGEPGAVPAVLEGLPAGLAEGAATCPVTGWPPVGWACDAVPEAGLAEPDAVLAAPEAVPDGLAEGATPGPVTGWPPVWWAFDAAPVALFEPVVSEAGSPLLLEA